MAAVGAVGLLVNIGEQARLFFQPRAGMLLRREGLVIALHDRRRLPLQPLALLHLIIPIGRGRVERVRIRWTNLYGVDITGLTGSRTLFVHGRFELANDDSPNLLRQCARGLDIQGHELRGGLPRIAETILMVARDPDLRVSLPSWDGGDSRAAG